MIARTCVALLVFQICSGADFDYCTISCDGQMHTMCAYKADGGDSCSAYKKGFTAEEKDVILDYHNQLRAKVAKGEEKTGPQPSAADMNQLVWDNEVAEIAQRWVEQCEQAGGHDKCRITKDKEKVGQNYAKSSGYEVSIDREAKIKELVKYWYNEVRNFSPSLVDNVELNGSVISNYMQLVWGKTTRLGCGLSHKQEGDKGEFEIRLICNYKTAGNFTGEPVYTQGEAASKCTTKSTKYLGLCEPQEKGDSPESDASASSSSPFSSSSSSATTSESSDRTTVSFTFNDTLPGSPSCTVTVQNRYGSASSSSSSSLSASTSESYDSMTDSTTFDDTLSSIPTCTATVSPSAATATSTSSGGSRDSTTTQQMLHTPDTPESDATAASSSPSPSTSTSESSDNTTDSTTMYGTTATSTCTSTITPSSATATSTSSGVSKDSSNTQQMFHTQDSDVSADSSSSSSSLSASASEPSDSKTIPTTFDDTNGLATCKATVSSQYGTASSTSSGNSLDSTNTQQMSQLPGIPGGSSKLFQLPHTPGKGSSKVQYPIRKFSGKLGSQTGRLEKNKVVVKT